MPGPDPVRERPPHDRFCDLILNGGVASGVVYPWAIVELARHYRFRRIAGNSVGAMAAALAAAAEYGRCHGRADAFEVLRRSPIELAEEDEQGRTQMLRLFQPAPGVRRLFECLLIGVRNFMGKDPVPFAALLTLRDVLGQFALGRWWLAGVLVLLLPALALADHPLPWAGLLLAATAGLVAVEGAKRRAGDAAGRGRILIVLLALLAGAHVLAARFLGFELGMRAGAPAWFFAGLLPALGVLGWMVVVALLGVVRLLPDLQALKENGYGLCPGRAQPTSSGEAPGEAALLEWLHRGIQMSAGREREDPPLTFADLWAAPRGGAQSTGSEESITLEVFSTNVTLARPISWPLRPGNIRLFFRKEEWARIFPPTLLEAVCKVALPYAPASGSDPDAGAATAGFLEVPAADLPIAVAARLSLSFPFLFSFVPVYTVDYEQQRGTRVLRRCLLTDGGLCTNFPIHLFDAAHPRWPTFGLMLARRIAPHGSESVWLPDKHLEGRADNWSRGVPGANLPGEPEGGLFGLLMGMLTTALDWNDNLTSRLPHVRNRVLRMALERGEGQLNIAMPGKAILRMAHAYGTVAGYRLLDQFVSDSGEPTPAWREHLYVRAMNQLRVLAEHLRGYPEAVTAAGFTHPLDSLLAEAMDERPLRDYEDRPPDPSGERLTPEQARRLRETVKAVAELAEQLQAAAPDFGPYEPVPSPKLQMRSRM